MDPCDVGNYLKEECHLTTLPNSRLRLLNISDLSEEMKRILFIRIRCNADQGESLRTICDHHRLKYLNRYEFGQKQCCNPFKVHKPRWAVKFRITVATERVIDNLKALGYDMILGQKLCNTCYKLIRQKMKVTNDTVELAPSEETAIESSSKSSVKGNNDDLDIRDIIKEPDKFSSETKIALAKKKLSQFTTKASDKITMGLRLGGLDPSSQLLDDGQKFQESVVNSIKSKMSECDENEVLSLLTILPDFWSSEKISSVFKVSTETAIQAKKLRKELGIMPSNVLKRKKRLRGNMKEK